MNGVGVWARGREREAREREREREARGSTRPSRSTMSKYSGLYSWGEIKWPSSDAALGQNLREVRGQHL